MLPKPPDKIVAQCHPPAVPRGGWHAHGVALRLIPFAPVVHRRMLVAGWLLAGPALLSVRAAADDRGGEPPQRIADLERRHGDRLDCFVASLLAMTRVVRIEPITL